MVREDFSKNKQMTFKLRLEVGSFQTKKNNKYLGPGTRRNMARIPMVQIVQSAMLR